jgi:SAM-dependent MidA family methyltransferase
VSAPTTLSERVAARIRADGPLGFDELVEAALYDTDAGFFSTVGGAGRSGGDFVTSPEVGPLFGEVMARALDAWWEQLGEPAEFTVVEVGAGRGALARSAIDAEPRCLSALRYVAVERSARFAGDRVAPASVEWRTDLPVAPTDGVVLANELLDNLGFRLLERGERAWVEVQVDVDDGALVEVMAPVDGEIASWASARVPDAAVGARIPYQAQAVDWLRRVLARLDRGRLVVFDYADDTPGLAARPADEWLRTYRAHARGGSPLEALGTQDITCEVAVDQLARVRPPDENVTQREFLVRHGLDDLVAEGRRIWQERAQVGDLQALKARSRIGEAAALTDPTGLGAFRVLTWVVG